MYRKIPEIYTNLVLVIGGEMSCDKCHIFGKGRFKCLITVSAKYRNLFIIFYTIRIIEKKITLKHA